MSQQARVIADSIKRHGSMPVSTDPAAATHLKRTIARLEDAKPANYSWRRYLIELLHVGASLEHALMVEYLYAAYTLQVEGAHRDVIKAWQTSLLMMAKEEMGHLLTVQNILSLLGESPYLQRKNYPWDAEFYPFVFTLEPLSRLSVARYAFAEMPPDWLDDKDHDRRTLKRQLAAVLQNRFGNKAGDPITHHVGTLYALIIDILNNPEWIPDSEFDAASYDYQAAWDDWGRGYVLPETPTDDDEDTKDTKVVMADANVIIERFATRDAAIAALKRIATQGEAPQSHRKRRKGVPLSHFERFLAMFKQYQRICSETGQTGWTPTRNMPTNPTTAAGNGIRARIKDDYAHEWAGMFNLRYEMLLTYLSHSFRLGRHERLRGVVMNKVFGEMYNLKTIAGILTGLPLGARGKQAGPPFEMPKRLLPAGTAPWQRHKELLQQSRHRAAKLKASRSKTASVEHRNYLRALDALDDEALRLIDSVLKASPQPALGRVKQVVSGAPKRDAGEAPTIANGAAKPIASRIKDVLKLPSKRAVGKIKRGANGASKRTARRPARMSQERAR